MLQRVVLPQHSQPRLAPSSRVWLLPLLTHQKSPWILSRCISPPSLTLPPAPLLGFDLQDLNNHHNRHYKNYVGFLKGISPAKHAKAMPTACSLIPAKEGASCWEEGEGGAGGSDPPVCDTNLGTASPLINTHLILAYLRALAAGLSGLQSWLSAVQPGIP